MHIYGDSMIIRSIAGKILYRGEEKTLKGAVENCALNGISLEEGDFRRAQLKACSFDEVRLQGANLWGSNLKGGDISHGDLRNVDLRNANLEEACFVYTDLTGADLRGASFCNTLFEGANLNNIHVSCPSFWACDFGGVESFSNVTYWYRGEIGIILDSPPLCFCGQHGRAVVLDSASLLWNGTLYKSSNIPFQIKLTLEKASHTLDRMLRCNGAECADSLSQR